MSISEAVVSVRSRAGTSERSGIAALFVAVAIWGSTFIVTDSILNSFGPFTILLLRFTIAFLCLAPFAARHGFRLRDIFQKRFVIFGFTGLALHLGLENMGLVYTTPGSASLIIASIPGVTALMSVLYLHEHITRIQWGGIVLSIAGVALITGARDGGGSTELLGNLLVLGGSIAWAVFTIQGKKMADGVPAIVSTAAAFGIAVLMMLPVSAGEIALQGAPQLSLGAIAGAMFLGVFASGAAYGLWNYALGRVDASVAGASVNLAPVIGVVLAMMLGERIGLLQWAGGAIVGVGVWLTQSFRPPTPGRTG
ncbi:MAG: DMT family transporter [Actinomycetota bacterium]